INQVNVQNRVSLAQPRLPDEVRQAGVTVNQASTSILLVANFSSEDAANPYSVEMISGLLDQNLTDAIRRVPGVGSLTYFGNRELAYRLWLDPARLTANGLSADDVVTAVRSQNRLVPAGQIGGAPTPPGQQYTLSVQLQGRLTSIADFENLILRTSADGGLLRLRDVGRVTLGGESFDVEASDLRGVPSVGMAIYQLSGSNALEVSRGVKEVLAEFEPLMPVGMTMELIYDNTDFINASIEGVSSALRDAVVLVVLVLFIFLQDWKATLVPAIAIPVALVGTFAFVKAFGFSLNQLTLFGLVLATGLVVDDAITVVEDTATKKASGLSALNAARATMDGLFGAVIATSLVLLAVFVPVLFFPGATGTIYQQFAATILFSVAISTFNALTFSPMLSALLWPGTTRPQPPHLCHRRWVHRPDLWPAAGRQRRGAGPVRPGGGGGGGLRPVAAHPSAPAPALCPRGPGRGPGGRARHPALARAAVRPARGAVRLGHPLDLRPVQPWLWARSVHLSGPA
ncbi:MAG: efflux RND transporter permease subunit, partial [Cyanobium sp.]